MNLPVEVITGVEQRRCVLFVGPTYSREAALKAQQQYPSGKTLAKALGWRKPRQILGARKVRPIPSVVAAAGAFQATHGRTRLIEELRLRLELDGVEPSEAHRISLKYFPFIVTTNYDTLLEQSAHAARCSVVVSHRGDVIPTDDLQQPMIYKLWGDFGRTQELIVTQQDHDEHRLSPAVRRQMRRVIRKNVILFVGYRPDEELFERLWAELTECYGGELPRCHMAVPQGKITDYLWQKWVWRGLLMFTADPTECMKEVEKRTN